MLLHHRIVHGSVVLPHGLARAVVDDTVETGAALRSDQHLFTQIRATIELPNRTVHVHAIVVRVVHAEKVVLIACRTPYPRTHADRLDGRLSQDPQHRVEMVDVLLDNDVAGQPGPVDPVTNHVFHLRPARLPGPIPQGPLVAKRTNRRDVANRTVAHAFADFDARQLATQLCAGQHREAQTRGAIGGRQDGVHARNVDRKRFLEEDVLTRINGGSKVHRPEMRRRGVEHHVDAGVEEFLVSVKTDEAT